VSRAIFTPPAESDLEGIGDYIALDNPRRALSFLAELRDQCDKIARSPLGYRARPEVADGLRSCVYGHYVIFFQPRATDVLIVRVLHGAQDIQAQFRE
jgi:toxin ParE1/3/4